jgi:hypothetical protein
MISQAEIESGRYSNSSSRNEPPDFRTISLRIFIVSIRPVIDLPMSSTLTDLFSSL